MSRYAHPAGSRHAEGEVLSPPWLRPPDDVNALVPELWPASAHRRSDGVVDIGGLDVTTIAGEFGTPAYLVDEDDFRRRARDFRDAFAPDTVYYAGKAFLCMAVARWVADEGLSLDVATGGELATAVRAGFPAERIAFHGNNKSPTELTAALETGVGRVIVDSLDEIARLNAIAESRRHTTDVLVRVTVGVEAHTHEYIATAHEDQKFGLSLTSGAASEAVARVLAAPQLRLIGLHSHIGSQIFDTAGFEVAARRVVQLLDEIRQTHGITLPELGLGGGFGIAYTTRDDPQPAKQLAAGIRAAVEHECGARDLPVPRLSVEPGRAIVGPTTFTLYEVGTVKRVELDHGASRLYVSVDGGMSDNIRPALYDADYSCTLASRASQAPPALARVVGKHCESGDIVVHDEFLPADIAPGDLLAVPGTGAYCRSMASNYNHLPRPPVIAVRGGQARVLVRRETIDDLLRLDLDA